MNFWHELILSVFLWAAGLMEPPLATPLNPWSHCVRVCETALRCQQTCCTLKHWPNDIHFVWKWKETDWLVKGICPKQQVPPSYTPPASQKLRLSRFHPREIWNIDAVIAQTPHTPFVRLCRWLTEGKKAAYQNRSVHKYRFPALHSSCSSSPRDIALIQGRDDLTSVTNKCHQLHMTPPWWVTGEWSTWQWSLMTNKSFFFLWQRKKTPRRQQAAVRVEEALFDTPHRNA